MSAVPSSRSPVPASRIRSDPVLSRTSTQAVLPPYRTVSGPGVGIEPRVPQKRIFIGRSGGRCLIALGEARPRRSGHSLVTGFGPGVLHGVERPLEVVDVGAHACDNARFDMITRHAIHDLERLLERGRGFGVARRGERGEGVSRRDDPRAKKDALRRQGPGVALAVHALVMLPADHRNMGHVLGEHEVSEEFAGLLGMGLHVFELGLVELSGLEKKLVAYRDLAVVVEQRGGANLLELYPLEPERPPDDLRISRHALAVTGGLLIARVNRHRERLDERRPKTPLLGDELRILDRNGRRCPERAQRFLVVRRELATSVLVHDLEYADDAIVLSGHWEREQRLSAAPGAMVGLGIEAGVLISIGDVDRLARGGDGARAADPDRLPDLACACAECDLRPDLGSIALDDEDRGAISVEDLGRDRRHVPQQGVQVGDRHETARHIEDEIELGPGCDFAFALAPRLGATIAPRPALIGHQLSIGMCSSTGPTVSAICSSSIWSRRSKAPLRLFRAWITPTTLCPSLPHTGTTSMFRVRNPVRRSTFRSKRASA